MSHDKREILCDLYFTDTSGMCIKEIQTIVQNAINKHFNEAAANVYRIDIYELAAKYPEHHELKRGNLR